MSFRPIDIDSRLLKFNSSASSDLLTIYLNEVDREISERNNSPKHRTFAPSSFRCRRLNWFRLRGVQPDKIDIPDRELDFTASMGTACHELIQSKLISALGEDWITIDRYFSEFYHPDYKYTIETKGYETLIEIEDPPVRFACDGVIRIKDKIYLLEIKSSDQSSIRDLTAPKPRHVDQIKCYQSLLNVDNALVLYIDRQYGSLKCFELKIMQYEKDEVWNKMREIKHLAECGIAPEGLPKGDTWCTPSMCPYYEKCKQWGR